MYGLDYVPRVLYFGSYHLPYTVLTLVLLFVRNCAKCDSLALSFSIFSNNLMLFLINWYSLRIYVDFFQGCYKDGTEPDTFDCHWFSALMLFTRPLSMA